MQKAREARRAARGLADVPVGTPRGVPAGGGAARPVDEEVDVPPPVAQMPVAEAPLSPPPAAAPPSATQPTPTARGDWSRLRRIELSPKLAPKRRLGALMGPQEAAPYDLLRTRVLRQMTENKWTRLAITSPNKACGKSTVSPTSRSASRASPICA